MSVFTGGKLHQNFIPIPYYTIITKPPCHIKQSNETITLWIKFKILTPIPTTSQSTSHLAFLTISCILSNENVFNPFFAKLSYCIRRISIKNIMHVYRLMIYRYQIKSAFLLISKLSTYSKNKIVFNRKRNYIKFIALLWNNLIFKLRFGIRQRYRPSNFLFSHKI